MTIQLTPDGLRAILPRAPTAVIDAFVAKQAVLDKAGITHTRTRLSIALSQVEHETAGFTIPHLTENVNYSPDRASKIWGTRFKSADDVYAKVGSWKGDKDFKRKLINNVYGGRMGNRRGTDDGFLFIGHGGPQWTGRDGHEALARILKDMVPSIGHLTAEQAIEYAIDYRYQPEVLAAFWMWKNLNPIADAGGLRAVTKPWNGGYIGMADREAKLAGNDPIVERMAKAERILPETKKLPGNPPTPTPPQEVIDATTKKERAARTVGVGSAGTGGAGEATKAGTEVPATPLLSPFVTYTLIGVGIGIVIVAAFLIARKKAAVVANWF